MKETWFQSWFMIGLIWAFWFVNYQALHVLMLTFLNGVFGARSEMTMSRLERDIVWTMAFMNRDYCLMHMSMGYEYDLADIQYIARTEHDDVVLDSFTS